jgi:hypothetical protein
MEAYDQSIARDLRAICVELIKSHRAELLREAGFAVEQDRLSCSVPFIRLLRTGAIDVGEPAFAIARDFVVSKWPKALRKLTPRMVQGRGAQPDHVAPLPCGSIRDTVPRPR